MNPVEGIQDQNSVSRQGVRRGPDADPALRSLGDTAQPYRRTGEVGGEFFEPLRFIVEDELACPAVAFRLRQGFGGQVAKAGSA